MRGPSRFAVAKERALDALDDLVPELFGGGKATRRMPQRWAVANKWRAKSDKGQMSVWRTGPRRGAWRDYAGGEKGDVIDLVAYGLQGSVTAETRMAALEWLEDRFGLRNLSPERQREISAAATARRAALEQQQAEQQLSDRDKVRKFFHGSEGEILGTPVETYLRGRGIPLEEVPNLTTAIRYRADCDYWMGAQRDGEGHKIGQVPRFPAMIAQMITPGGQHGACHYTFLEPDGASKLRTGRRGYLVDPQRFDGPPRDRFEVDEAEGKDVWAIADGAPIGPLLVGKGRVVTLPAPAAKVSIGRAQSAKLMFPSSMGMFIPLTYGPSGMRARDAAAASIADWWGFTEGIEDGLSAAICNAQLRMHAASSLAHLMGIPDHPACRGYLIFKDNDWGKPEAQAQFDRAIARLKQFGKPVEALAMPADWGKDINEALNRKEP